MRRAALAPSTLVLALALLAATGAPAEAQLATTDPQHYGQGAGAPAGAAPGPSLRDFKGPKYRRRVVLERRANLQQLGAPSRRLSRACREGRFRQAIDRRYVAVLDDRTYGAAIGGSATLYDPDNAGQTGLVYVFVGQGTTNCQVIIGGTPNGG